MQEIMKNLNEYLPELKKAFKSKHLLYTSIKLRYNEKENDIILTDTKSSILGSAIFEVLVPFCKENRLYFIVDKGLEITIYG